MRRLSFLMAALWGTASAAPPASVLVKCAPKAVKAGDSFYVNTHFAAGVNRPLSIHVDALNAETNDLIAHGLTDVTGAEGDVATKLTLPADAPTNVTYNVFMTALGETWPNVLAATSFHTLVAAKAAAPCAPVKTAIAPPSKDAPEYDYVVLETFPRHIQPGKKVEVLVAYNLATKETPSSVSAAVIKTVNDTAVAWAKAPAKEGQNTVKITIEVPEDADLLQPVYLVANLIPDGKDWTDRLADDRINNVALGAAPAANETVPAAAAPAADEETPKTDDAEEAPAEDPKETPAPAPAPKGAHKPKPKPKQEEVPDDDSNTVDVNPSPDDSTNGSAVTVTDNGEAVPEPADETQDTTQVQTPKSGHKKPKAPSTDSEEEPAAPADDTASSEQTDDGSQATDADAPQDYTSADAPQDQAQDEEEEQPKPVTHHKKKPAPTSHHGKKLRNHEYTQ